MNKLKKKTFWTILIILSLFLISILVIFSYQGYTREKQSIERNLFKMNNEEDDNNYKNKNNEDFKPDKKDIATEPIEEINSKRFMDATIYTIILDQDNNIVEVISHTEDGIVNENVKKLVSKIINNNSQSNTYIGNLYFSQYSYHYEKNKLLILLDNTDANERLISTLKITILLFILLEIIIIIISKILSQWLIKPVELSFKKQKQFIAGASHELKTPLSVIIACAEALENNPDEHKWLENIQTESERMNKLITNLLDLAKIENEKNKKIYEEVNLSKLVEKSILTLESLIYEKNIKLEYKIEAVIKYKCNSEEMKQLVSILMDNAIKQTDSQGKIIVELNQEKNNIILKVKNKGTPIPKGEEEKIFDRFYRSDKSRNRNENRYGLGLAIAKKIVTNHSGSIFASSNHNYTTFTVILKK